MMRWPEWLTYCPRGKTRAEWKAEFERDHAPKYDQRIRQLESEMKSVRPPVPIGGILIGAVIGWFVYYYTK